MVPNVKLTAIVVAKRHHVRLFPTCPQDETLNNGNCKPGTLVDTAVTSPYFQDFYLQSHNGIKGTAKSAHYFVLLNEMGMNEMAIQQFVSNAFRYSILSSLLYYTSFFTASTLTILQTHRLCYTYVRATMGVSYAPPAYYADRLCERGRYVS